MSDIEKFENWRTESEFSFSVYPLNTVSAFRGKGKQSAWQVWKVYEEAPDVFRKLGNMSETILDGENQLLSSVLSFYAVRRVNETKLNLFAQRQKSYGQHFQSQNINSAGKKMTTTGSHIVYIYLQWPPAAKSLQNVVLRYVASLETVIVLSLA